MAKFKPVGNFINFFQRRGWWRINIKPADADVKEAEQEGIACAEQKTVCIKDGVLQGPGVDKFAYQLEMNMERTVADIEEDCAPLIQTLSPIYADYQGVVEKLVETASRLDASESKYKQADPGREKNQARIDMEAIRREYDSLFERAQALRLEAEQGGLPDLRAIQASRLAQALRRRAHQDYLKAVFVKGACSVLGEECASSRIDLKSTTSVIDAYIDQLEGRAGDGRWTMDFTRHLRHKQGTDKKETILSGIAL